MGFELQTNHTKTRGKREGNTYSVINTDVLTQLPDVHCGVTPWDPCFLARYSLPGKVAIE